MKGQVTWMKGLLLVNSLVLALVFFTTFKPSTEDEKGHEYAGLGLSKTKEGKYRTVLGLDDPEVGESMHLFILEDGNRELQIAHPQGRLLLGAGPKDGWVFILKEDFVESRQKIRSVKLF